MKTYVVSGSLINSAEFKEILGKEHDKGDRIFICYKPADRADMDTLNAMLRVVGNVVVGTVSTPTKEVFLVTLGMLIGGQPEEGEEIITLLPADLKMPDFLTKTRNVKEYGRKPRRRKQAGKEADVADQDRNDQLKTTGMGKNAAQNRTKKAAKPEKNTEKPQKIAE